MHDVLSVAKFLFFFDPSSQQNQSEVFIAKYSHKKLKNKGL